MEPQEAHRQPQGAPQCHSAAATVPQCLDEITDSPHLSEYNSDDENELEQQIREQKRRARRKQEGGPPSPFAPSSSTSPATSSSTSPTPAVLCHL